MEPKTIHGSYHPISQIKESEIDPRLQDAAPNSQSYPNAPPIDGNVSQYRLPPPPPPPPPPFQHPHQQRQHLYGAPPPPPPQWAQDGFNSYYPPSNQHQPPVTQAQQHTRHAYQPYHVPGGTSVQAPLQAPLPDTADARRSRACEACRNLKVKCEPDPAGGMCKRCAKANRSCVITAPSRKRQKKTDGRVAELEKKIDALTQNLKSTREGNVSGSDDGILGEDDILRRGHTGSAPSRQIEHDLSISDVGQKRSFTEYQQDGNSTSYAPNLSTAANGHPSLNNAPHLTPEVRMGQARGSTVLRPATPSESKHNSVEDIDVVGRGVLQQGTADELFLHYTEVMAPHMPIVMIPQDTRPDSIQKSCPVLFLAILSVASGQKYPDLQRKFKKFIMHTLLDRVVNGQSKSLEMLQAIQIITIWYLPEPDQESKYYQLIHMAVGLAIDLGINRKPNSSRNKFSILQHNSTVVDTESVDCRRAWLGTYLLSSSVAMGMRRPNLIRNDGYLQDCMAALRLSESPLDTDGILCKLVYLQTLADDLSGHILPDDYVPIAETKARSAYKGFEKQMKDWQAQNAGNVLLRTLSLTYNVIHLYMHELVMQHVTSIEPKNPPSRSRGKNQSQSFPPGQGSSLSVALILALGILDNFLKFNAQEVQTLPTFYFAQIAHAIVSLIKMYFVARADSELSKHAPVTADMIEEHLNRLVDSLRSASSGSLAAATSLRMVTIIQTLFGEHKDSTLETIKTRYSGIPSLKGTQMFGLEEPQPTPQQRTATRGNAEAADDALHVLSAVAMGKTHTNGYISETGEPNGPKVDDFAAVDGETAAMGQLIGEGDMGSMSDEGFTGIMQVMWARSR